MNIFKGRCVELRRSDHTILEISKITGRAKSSIYFHIKDIPLSPEKQRQIKINCGLRATSLSVSRKGKSLRTFKKFNKWNENLVSLVAHLIFDGEINPRSCTYNNRSHALLNKVETLMKLIYEFEPIKYLDKRTGVNRISYHNVELAAYLKRKSIELIEEINSLPKKSKKEFLSAFFDDEGCVDFRVKHRIKRVRGYQKDTAILILVQELLKDFGIDSAIHKPNEVVIIGKKNLEKFQKEINFSPGVHINGNRSNSIWKKSFEKRYLLDQAIKSFEH